MSSNSISLDVAFIGLGVMGYPMAGHLASAGHRVTVYNRTRAKAERWLGEFSGQIADTPAGAAAKAEVVFACVGNDDDVRAICTGDEGAFHGMRDDAVFVDHTTASAELARELDVVARERGLHFLDAPVSGGEAGAVNGMLTVMVGGEAADFDRVKDAIDAYARAVSLMGPAGSGQLTKMVNQICIAGLVQALAEGLSFAQRVGPRRQAGRGRHLQGSCAVLADGEPRSNDARRRVRVRLRGGVDAEGPRDMHGGSAPGRRPGFRSRHWSTSSMPRCRPRAGRAGIHRA